MEKSIRNIAKGLGFNSHFFPAWMSHLYPHLSFGEPRHLRLFVEALSASLD